MQVDHTENKLAPSNEFPSSGPHRKQVCLSNSWLSKAWPRACDHATRSRPAWLAGL
jgi:hypothetical protein